jgi:hypothetical protein
LRKNKVGIFSIGTLFLGIRPACLLISPIASSS